MSALAVDAAIRRRFAEAYRTVPGLAVLENDPFPELTNTSYLVGDGEGGHCPPLAVRFPFGGGQFERVVVFLENENGHDYKFEHHVSFQNVRSRWRTEEGSTGRDKECLGWTDAVTSDGSTIKVPNLVRERPQAEPESLYYDFHIVSRSYRYAQQILSTVKLLFPKQGALTIERLNGNFETIDMHRTTDAFRSSPFDATLTSGDPGVRRYRWTMQYEAESYEDNTLHGEWKQTITRVCDDVDLMPKE